MESDIGKLLRDIAAIARREIPRGRVASYIPALARVPPGRFAMAAVTVDGDEYAVGDADEPFSIQSISKVFTLSLAMARVGENLFRRVGREPSGNPFNSLVQLEHEAGIPRNPLINAGALVVTDHVLLHEGDARHAILALVRDLSGNAKIDYDGEVARSEARTGFRNAALANFLKAHDNLENPVEEVLDVYFHQCALAVSCRDLARSFLYLANGGVQPNGRRRVVTARQAKRMNALMMTSGLYDAAGDFAYRVGLPAKSGVGGGIVAVVPGKLALAVWSPALDRAGNSRAGVRALEMFTTRTGLSVF